MSKNTENIIRKLPRGYLSVSQINCFLQCGYKYFYRYVLRRETASGLALVYGKAGHHALEMNAKSTLEKGKPLWPEHLIASFNQYLDQHEHEIADWDGKTKSGVKQEAAELLTEFYNCYADYMIPNEDGIEKKFTIEVAGIPIVGYIDFIGSLYGIQSVVDYKFVGRAKTQEDTDTDIQLTVYSLATGIKDVSFISLIKPHPYFHPDPEVIASYSKRTDDDTEALTKIVRKVASDISRRKFKPSKRGHPLCSKKFCDHWDECPSGGHPDAPTPDAGLEEREKMKGRNLLDILEDG